MLGLGTALLAAVAFSCLILVDFRNPIFGFRHPKWIQTGLLVVAYTTMIMAMLLLKGPLENSTISSVSRAARWIGGVNSITTNISGAPPYALFLYIIALLAFGGTPGWVVILPLAGGTILLVRAVGRVVTSKGRRQVFDNLHTFGWLVPFAYSLLVLFLGLAFFSTFTLQLYRHHMLSLETSGNESIATLRVVNFYLWHVADAIPLREVTKTAKWDEPLKYSDHKVGGLVLCYKLIIILPLIGAFTSFWSFWRNREQSSRIPNPQSSDGNGDNPKPS